jgi:hypothetical protein
MNSRVPIVLFAFVAACNSAPRSASNRSSATQDSVARCGLMIPRSLPPDSIAIQCAEGFIARNGYTDLPVLDTTGISRELIEPGTTATEILGSRRASLGRRAVVFCHDRRETPGFTVGFVSPGDTTLKIGRAVTMDSAFGQVRIEHVAFLPGVAVTMPGCVSLLRSRSQSR